MRKYNHSKHLYYTFFFVILSISLVTIGYASYTTRLSISQISAQVEREEIMFVSGVNTYTTTNSASVTSTDFDDTSIIADVVMPSGTSTVALTIDLTNLGNVAMGINSITGLPNTMKLSTSDDFKLQKSKLCGVDNSCDQSLLHKSFTLTIEYINTSGTYNSTPIHLDLTVNFAPMHSITYVNFTNSYQSEITNGGTLNANQISTFVANDTVTLLDPSKTDYVFLGWYESPTFTGSKITSISNRTSDVDVYAKWGMLLSKKIETIYSNNETSTDSNCEYAFANDDPDHNLRFIGVKPCNYVSLKGENWRIIGVFYGMSTTTKTNQTLVKLIYPTPTQTSIKYDSNSKNTWPNTSMYSYLNTNFFNTMVSSQRSQYVENVIWNVGAVSASSTPVNFYNGERGSTGIGGVITAEGYLGLYYPSDYGYACGSSVRSNCLSTSIGSWSSTMADSNWLFYKDNEQNQWTITPRANTTNQAYRITNAGRSAYQLSNTSSYARPALYLKADVLFDDSVSSTGASTSPFQIKLE